MPAPTFRLLDRPAEIEDALAALSGQPFVAIDLEADGLHSYRAKVCLVQATTAAGTFILDPLAAPSSLRLLAPVLEDRATLKIFHGGDFDVRQLKALLDCRVQGLFDTMIAAQLLGRPQVGLAALLAERFGVTLDKRFQRADWSARPLPPAMLEYAALDTAYLPQLRGGLAAELAAHERTGWAEEEFRLLEAVEPAPPRPPWCLDVKGAGRLAPRQLAVLQALLEVREAFAQAADRPPFKIVSNQVLLAWAAEPPRTRRAVMDTPGAGKGPLARIADAILEAVSRGLALPDDACPRPTRGPRREPLTKEQDHRLDRLRTARAGLAARLAIEPGLIVSSANLERVAREEPEAGGAALATLLKRWQLEVAGEDLRAALA